MRYLGINADDAIEIAEKIDILLPDALPPIPDVVGGAGRAAGFDAPMLLVGSSANVGSRGS